MRRINTLVAMLFAAVAVSSYAGYVVGRLAAAQERENNYPWDLHRKLNTPAISCSDLAVAKVGSRFFVQQSLSGEGVRLITYDRTNSRVQVSIIGANHERANDSWELFGEKCN
jgi:hypothetical protein